MRPPDPASILTFVPAKDFAVSTRFYETLGFTHDGADDVRFMRLGSFGFLLQDYYVEEWANNFMMAMHVSNVNAWHLHATDLDLTGQFDGVRLSEPALEDWGMIVMHLIDPSGVLWHITQDPPARAP